MTQYAFYFDQSRCYSCHACAVACKDWNGIEAGPEKWMTVYEWEEGNFLNMRVKSLAFPCAHCDDPACIKACKWGVLIKDPDTGAVLVDTDRCSGCRQCYVACPYGAPKFADDTAGSRMSKCNMCVDRLGDGELPVCVSSCPLRAFDFGPVEEMEAKYGTSRQLEGMPDPSMTGPNFIVSPAAPHRELISYDREKAIKLFRRRGDLGSVFESEDDVIGLGALDVDRGKLEMKHASSSELMANTRNNIG